MAGKSNSEAEVEWAPGEALDLLVCKLRVAQVQRGVWTEVSRDGARLILRDIAVLRCPAGATALEDMEIAPGLGLGDLTKGQLARWYYGRGRAAAMARERVRPRLEPLEAELGLRPTVQPLAGGRAEG